MMPRQKTLFAYLYDHPASESLSRASIRKVNALKKEEVMPLKRRLSVSFVAVLSTALVLSSAAFGAEGRFERTLQVTGPVELDILTTSGDVTVRTGDAATVRVIGRIKTSPGLSAGEAEESVRYLESNPPIEQNGSLIRIGQMKDRQVGRNISVSYELVVPVETRLHSKGESGDLTVMGIRGPVESNSSSGDLKISNVSKGVNAATSSGDVELEETGPGNVQLATSSGDVKISGAPGALRIATSSGDVTIHVPEHAAFELHAQTTSGEIQTRIPIVVHGSTSPHEVRGKVRGGGFLVEINTGSGEIRVDQQP